MLMKKTEDQNSVVNEQLEKTTNPEQNLFDAIESFWTCSSVQLS